MVANIVNKIKYATFWLLFEFSAIKLRYKISNSDQNAPL